MANDEELVGRLADGDARALGELLARWDRPLHAFIARSTGGRDVEDLRQEAWMRVLRAAASFDRSRRFSTWLFQIALNLCRDWHRQARPEPLAESADGPSSSPPPGEAGLDARRLLDLLPEAQRNAMILRYYHDLSEQEMAEVLGCPRGTVKSRLHQAVQRLLAIVQADERPAGYREEKQR